MENHRARTALLVGIALAIAAAAGGHRVTAQTCSTDFCTSCDRPAAGVDADHDGVPDDLEYDLAHRFFPTIFLQGYDYDVDVSYLHRGWSIPFSVAPLTGDMCDEDRECLEVRYGIAYSYDFGDNEWYIRQLFDAPHEGDSEFYAVLLQRTAPWATAAGSASSWQLIRDFTSAHWGTPTDSSRMVSYGYCPPECTGFSSESSCTSHNQCSWFQGFCAGTSSSSPGTYCGNEPDQESCQFSGCRWLPPSCNNRGDVHCYSTSPRSTYNVLYASERKHGLYHSDSECDSGAATADECPSNVYDMRADKANLLQNIGGVGSVDHVDFDTDLQAPNGCALNRVWDDPKFGESTPYKQHFTTPMNWNLPAAAPAGGCGEASCVPSQGTYVSHFSGPGCTGTESYYLPYDGYAYSCRSWNGGGQCGTIHRTVTNYSARINGGPCQDLWPAGNTLSDFVTIYR